uniref:CSON005726 protein n=1 Tax=Culicoides sonorensis TaxID=179676 RepID=A0A336L7G7_CULSO
MMFWEKNEVVFLRAPYKQGHTLRRKVIMSSVCLFFFATAEHILAKASSFYGISHEASYCNHTVDDRFKFYALREHYQIYQLIDYNPLVSLIFYALSAFLTFSWSFLDYFIILLSMGISERFRQINLYLCDCFENSSIKISQPEFWKMLRYHFGLVCEILEFVDEKASVVIIVSCLSNLYFICLQVLNITVKLPYTINVVYFWFSLGFLIVRTCAVFLCAAEINEQAEVPLDVIRHLPNAVWNMDIERLADQIRTQTVALSGMRFFHMTRRLLFGMMGTIITYEIVMMQNDSSSRNPYRITCAHLM